MATLVGQKKGKQIEVSTDGQRLIYKAPREYLVYDDTGTAGEGDILLTAGLPSVNLAYVFDGVPVQLVCKSKSAQQWENNNKYWTVTAEFDNEPQNTESDTGGNETDPGDPTTWYSIVKFDFETIETPITGLVNFAKRPYSPPAMRKELIPVIKFTQYMPPDLTIYDLINDYHNVVNDNDFLAIGPRVWLLTISNAEFGVTNGFRCWKVDFELRYHVARLHELELLGDETVKVYDNDGNDITSGGSYAGWDLYIPQIDTVDKNRRPFSDIFENSGEAGKLGTDGLFLSDQENEPLVVKRHLIPEAKDFSFIRIRNIQ
jgi:hypothetical protein